MEFPHVQTFDVDDTRAAMAIGGRLFYEHRLRTVRRGDRFGGELRVGRLGPIMAGLVGYRTEVEIISRGLEPCYALTLPVTGCVTISSGGVELSTDQSTATILGEGDDVRIRGWRQPHDTLLLMKFDTAALEAELGRMLGRSIQGRIGFAPVIDLTTAEAGQWLRLTGMVTTALRDASDMVWNPLLSARLSGAIMAGLLLVADHDWREQLDARTTDAPPPVIARAMQIIDERAATALSVTGIATELNVSVRALQSGFRRYCDTTPTGALARARLQHAHEDLLVASPRTDTVAAIATRWRFRHHGRFAAAYRATYGCAPSQTLRDR